jgi:hypothetical protein
MMRHIDALDVISTAHREDLMREAERERVIAQLPLAGRTLRAQLAQSLHAIADWLEPHAHPAPEKLRFSAPRLDIRPTRARAQQAASG